MPNAQQPTTVLSDPLTFWTKRWQELVEARRVQVESLDAQGPQHDFWDRRAAQFHEMSRRLDPLHDPVLAHLRSLAAGGTLLDVGAGTGRYAIPAASFAREITAVEPSDGMRRFLADGAAATAQKNVTIVGANWEAANVPVHDVVLASHILYPIMEIVPFLRKLDAHARTATVVIIRIDQIGTDVETLWQQIWGTPRAPEPTFLDLYNLLFALGWRANAEVIPFGPVGAGGTLDELLDSLRGMLFLRPDQHEHDQLIRDHIRAQMVEENGRWASRRPRQAAIIWWGPGVTAAGAEARRSPTA